MKNGHITISENKRTLCNYGRSPPLFQQSFHSNLDSIFTSEYGGQEFFEICAEERETTRDEIVDWFFHEIFLFFHPIFIFVFLPHQRAITELIGIRWGVTKRRYREIVEHSTRRWNTIPKCLFFISRFLFLFLFFCSDTASVESRLVFSVVWQSQLSKDDWNGHGIHVRLST